MTTADLIGGTTITEVWKALGGDPPKHGRARAFFRDGDNRQAVSLNDEKGCWFDHRDHAGGGVLAIIQHVRSCDRRAALRWLSDFTGLPLENRPLTTADRARYARARHEASELVAWKERLAEALKDRRMHWLRIYHGTLRYVLQHGFDSPLSNVMATLHEVAEDEVNRLQTQLDTLKTASFADFVPVFRELTRRLAA